MKRVVKENLDRNERIVKLDIKLRERHAMMFSGEIFTRDLHSGCIYEPHESTSAKPLIFGAFRFLKNIDNAQLNNIELVLAGYQMKYPRALFMVDLFSTLIARDHEGNILNWDRRNDGLSIWYAPKNAFDFICPISGVILL